jgi:hypothetical protein
MSQVTVKYLKPMTAFGMPEFFVQAPNNAPRTTWSAVSAAKAAISMGAEPNEAADLVKDAIISAEV